jgi:hypothetical protein
MTTYDDLAQGYIDPLAVAEGRDAIAATIAPVQQQFPGFMFRLTGAPGHAT